MHEYCQFQDRYSSFNSGIGAKIGNGTATLEECEVSIVFEVPLSQILTTPHTLLTEHVSHFILYFQAFILKTGEPVRKSGKQEHYEAMLNHYV